MNRVADILIQMSCNGNNLATTVLANLCAGKDRDILKLLNLGVITAFSKFYHENETNPNHRNIIIWSIANISAMENQNYEKLFEVLKH